MMLRSRVLYAAALLAAFLFHVFNTSYIAWFLWVLVVCLPFLALALSLPAILGCHITITPDVYTVQRGVKTGWGIELKSRFKLPIAHVTWVFKSVNLLTGFKNAERMTMNSQEFEDKLYQQAATSHCGLLECCIEHVRVCDCLGLFAIRRPSARACLTVFPVAAQVKPLPDNMGENAGSANVLRLRHGGGPGEDYDLRAYRPGDPIRSIHWKLSSKREELIVRETLEAQKAPILLTFDHFGSADDMDRIFDRLDGYCRLLLEKGHIFFVQWVQPLDSRLRSYQIADEHGRKAFLAAALADPAPETGHSVLETKLCVQGWDNVRHFHITVEKEDGLCAQTPEEKAAEA